MDILWALYTMSTRNTPHVYTPLFIFYIPICNYVCVTSSFLLLPFQDMFPLPPPHPLIQPHLLEDMEVCICTNPSPLLLCFMRPCLLFVVPVLDCPEIWCLLMSSVSIALANGGLLMSSACSCFNSPCKWWSPQLSCS